MLTDDEIKKIAEAVMKISVAARCAYQSPISAICLALDVTQPERVKIEYGVALAIKELGGANAHIDDGYINNLKAFIDSFSEATKLNADDFIISARCLSTNKVLAKNRDNRPYFRKFEKRSKF